jgi:hypothetical protein
MKGKWNIAGMFFVIMTIGMATGGYSQKLTYTQPDRNENRQTNFEIIGKYGDHYLIYKNYRASNYISVFDASMALVKNENMPYMPEKIIEANFVSYPDFSYLFFQYQQKGVVFCKAVKIGPDGKNLTEPIDIDTTIVGSNTNSKIYQITPSEDKSRIMVFRINSKNEQRLLFKTLLFDKELSLIHSTKELVLRMSDRSDFLTDFNLDNDGNLVFGKGIRGGQNENITKFFLHVKWAKTDSFYVRELAFDRNSLDEVKLKMDNFNNRYLFVAFYYNARRGGTIEGIGNAIFDKGQKEWVVRNAIPFSDDVREDARGQNSSKNAFQDYFIKDLTIRSDGAFLVNAESLYQTSRGNVSPYNRWNMMSPAFMSPMDYYRYGGYGSPWGWGSPYGPSNSTRYNADNVMILAFNKEGKLMLSNFVRKSQFDDNNENMVSYQMVNTGNGLQYLYNDYDRRDVVLTYQTLTPKGQVIRNPTIKGIARDYDFIPRFAKQVDKRVVIIPCLYRNTLSFAKLEFDE